MFDVEAKKCEQLIENDLEGQSECYKIYIDMLKREIKIVLWCWIYNTDIAHMLEKL